MDDLHRRIRTARQAAGLSQERLAELVGVTLKTVNRWEAEGGHTPRAAKLAVLEDVLGVTLVVSKPRTKTVSDIARLERMVGKLLELHGIDPATV